MIEFANKKNVKVVSLAIAAIFVIGASPLLCGVPVSRVVPAEQLILPLAK